MAHKVFLSAGHGGTDPGAVALGLKEKDINLQTLLACNEVLVRHGVSTVLSRTTDANDPVADEVKEANASGASLAVSFHANAGGGDGFEAYYYSTDANGKKMAQCGEKYVKALGQNSRGIKTGNHLYFIKKTKMTSVLFESFFVDNDKDNDIGDTVAEQKAFGVAYAKAILEYLGVTYKEESAEPKPAASTPKVSYFKKYAGTSGSIVTALNSIGAKSTFAYRSKIAKANGIAAYMGTATQNTKMLNLLKKGKLIKP